MSDAYSDSGYTSVAGLDEFQAFKCPDCGRTLPGPAEALSVVVDCPRCEAYRQYEPVSSGRRLIADGGREDPLGPELTNCPVCGAVGLPERIEDHDCESFRDRQGLDDDQLVTDGGRRQFRLNDSVGTIALDASDYPEVNRVTTIDTEYLKSVLTILRELGWDAVAILAIPPTKGDDEPALALRPPGESLFGGENAAITITPLTEKGREKQIDVDPMEAEDA